MCSVDAPAPTVIEADKPTFVRNPFLDELDADVASADALRRGRSSLVIPTGDGIGFSGRGGTGGSTGTGDPNGNGSSGGIGGSGGGPFNPGTPPPGGIPGRTFPDGRGGRGRQTR